MYQIPHEHYTGRLALCLFAIVLSVLIITVGICNYPSRPYPKDSEEAITQLARDQEAWFHASWDDFHVTMEDREQLLKYRELLLEDQCMRLNAHLAFMDKKNGQIPEPIKLPKNKEEVAAAVKQHEVLLNKK